MSLSICYVSHCPWCLSLVSRRHPTVHLREGSSGSCLQPAFLFGHQDVNGRAWGNSLEAHLQWAKQFISRSPCRITWALFFRNCFKGSSIFQTPNACFPITHDEIHSHWMVVSGLYRWKKFLVHSLSLSSIFLHLIYRIIIANILTGLIKFLLFSPSSHVRLFVTPWTAACQASLSSPSPRICSNSCSWSWWCHPAILFSVVFFSFCPQSFPASGSFPMSQLFASGGQSIRTSASASVLPMDIQGWFPLGLTGLISFQSKRLSRVFSNTTVQKHQFFSAQLSL